MQDMEGGGIDGLQRKYCCNGSCFDCYGPCYLCISMEKMMSENNTNRRNLLDQQRAHRSELAGKIIEMHGKGLNYREIGDNVGFSYERVRQILAEFAPVEGYRKQARTKLKELVILNDGITINEAAEALGCSYQAARTELIRRGVKYRKRYE